MAEQTGRKTIAYIGSKQESDTIEHAVKKAAGLNDYIFVYVADKKQLAEHFSKKVSAEICIISYELPKSLGKNGIELTALLRETYDFHGIIMLTSSQESKSIVKAFRTGVSDVVIRDEDGSYIDDLINSLHAASEKHTAAETDDFYNEVPVGLYRITENGDFINFNRTFLEMTGAPSRESLIMDNFFYLYAHQGDKQNWFEILRRDDEIRGLELEVERYDGQIIWVRDNARPIYNKDGAIKYIDGSLENVTLRKETEKKLTFLATHDMLTGLPNRNFFNDQTALSLSQARYKGDLLAVLLFDIDYFNEINTTYGYPAGDELLKQVAKRVSDVLRKSDLLARMSGDEFLLLISGVRGRRDILSVAQKITAAFTDPFVIQDKEITVSVSIGIAFFPDHGEDVSILVKHADIAMYSVKHTKRGGYQIYSEDLALYNQREADQRTAGQHDVVTQGKAGDEDQKTGNEGTGE